MEGLKMATYGWAGKILRVNLTNRSVSTQSVDPYKEYVGGMGIGYKIIWDEVPLTTDPYAPEAKFVIAVGPLTGSGVPCSGRTNISFLTAITKGKSICDGHMGGHFGNVMKYAGYDAIVVEGRSPTPVYLKIDDDRVTIERADHLWGKYTRESNKLVIEECGPEFTSFAIGPAGENIVNYSIILTSWGNIGGGGIGAICGSKNLKAVAVRGTGGVAIADPKMLMELNNYMLTELIGANNNHPIPTYAQSWAEFTAQPPNRWRGGPGLRWERALGGPVDTGEQPHWEINRIAYRMFKGIQDFTEARNPMQYTVKQSGCSSCPTRCYTRYDYEPLKALGENPKVSNTCVAVAQGVGNLYGDGVPPDIREPNDGQMVAGGIASKWFDELGLWENYMHLHNEFRYCVQNRVFERVLPRDEFNSIPWDLMRNKDPRWIPELLTRIAYKRGELSHIGEGAFHIAKRWNLPQDFFDGQFMNAITDNGYPRHHSSEDGWQSAILYNVIYNRDCMVHTLTNFVRCGSPFPVIRRVLEGFFGPGCVDPPLHYTPINDNKVKLGVWCLLKKQWHDMATLCDWMWPMTMSPSRERGYSGDIELEAKFMTAVTGDRWTMDDVHLACEKVTNMLRVMTAISFRLHENSSNLRQDHDRVTAHYFDRDPQLRAFQQGTNKLDRADMERAFDMFYDAMGWDRRTGIPTRATLTRLGLRDMADRLAQHGILPA
jgi:aldehyde:ferredoxin oxidoreductase